MSYRVILNERAEAQLEATYLWWREHRSAEQATHWYNRFLDALNSLRENPDRCGLARENPRFPYAVHELLFGLAGRTHDRCPGR